MKQQAPICPPTPRGPRTLKRTTTFHSYSDISRHVDYNGYFNADNPTRIFIEAASDFNPELSDKRIKIRGTDMIIHIKPSMHLFDFEADIWADGKLYVENGSLHTFNINPFYSGDDVSRNTKSFRMTNSDGKEIRFDHVIQEGKHQHKLARANSSPSNLEQSDIPVPLSLLFKAPLPPKLNIAKLLQNPLPPTQGTGIHNVLADTVEATEELTQAARGQTP